MSSIVTLTDLETGTELHIPVQAIAQKNRGDGDAVYPRPGMGYAMDHWAPNGARLLK